MMPTNPRPHPEWRLVVDALQAAAYDSVYAHEALAEIMHVPPRSCRYYGQMQRARRHLREYQRELETVRTQGYRIIQPREHQAASRRKVVIGLRHHRTAIAIAQATAIEQLTPEESAKLANHLSHVGSLVTHGRSALQKTRLGILPAPKADVPKMLG